MKPFVVTARTPKDFEAKVLAALQCGYAIDNAPFLIGELLCQWVKPMPNYYEWKLLVGASLGDLQAEVQNYWGQGFDFLYNPLAFEARDVFVQWVQRWKSVHNHLIAEAEQMLVEGVQAELSAFPVVEGAPKLKLVVASQPLQILERGSSFQSFRGEQ